jgi:hypothetical protein
MHVTAHQTFVDTAGQAAGDGVRYQHCQAQRYPQYVLPAHLKHDDRRADLQCMCTS